VRSFLPPNPPTSADHNDKVAVRIGEASHPGPRSRKLRNLDQHVPVWTCNIQGPKHSWTLQQLLQTQEQAPQIVLLQECSFSQAEWTTFQKTCWSLGYRSFFSGAQSTVNRHHGGAAVLVKSSLPCRPAWSQTHKGGSAQAVWVGSTLVISTYLAPNSDAETVSAAVAQTVHSLAPRHRFILGGDYNATPEENPFLHFLIPREFRIHATQTPTRWQGNRDIDYYISNLEPTEVETLPDVVADHKIAKTFFDLSTEPVLGFQQANIPRILPKDPEVAERIQIKLAQLWPQFSTQLPERWSVNADQDWQMLSQTFFKP